MSDAFVVLLWVQAGGAFWLAFILQLGYRRVYREPFLHFWSLSFVVMGVSLVAQLAVLPPSPKELFTSPIPYLLGIPQFPLVILAALSLKPPAPSRRRQILLVASIVAGLLVLYLVTDRMIADPLKLARTVRFERLVLGVAAGAWFCAAFWRWHSLARTAGGRVTVLFTALRVLHYAAQAASVAGLRLLYPDPHSVISGVVATIMPFGIAAGMIMLAGQAMTAATRRLRDSEERYHTLVDASPDAIVATDTSGTILTCNRRAAEAHGYASAADLIGQPAPMLLAPADRERVHAEILSARKDGGPVNFECQILLRDGSQRFAELTTAPLRAGDGTVAGNVTIVHDITARKEADRALLREREFSAQVIDAIPGVFFVLDRQGRYVRWNRNQEIMIGMPPDAIRAAQALARVHPDDRQRVAETVAAVFANGSAEVEARGFLGQSQEIRHFLLTGRRMELDGEAYLVGCGVDITERKEAEAARKRLESQLLQSQKLESIGRLAGGVAHDFNNLLTVISGYGHMLMDKLDPADPRRESLTEILRAGDRAAGLTQQLLAFSRKQVISPAPLCLNDVVRETEKMLRRLIGEDIELVTDLAPGLRSVVADRGQMHQVLLNLAVNARDALPLGGRIVIALANVDVDAAYAAQCPDAKTGSHVLLTVTDNGVGMNPEVLQHVFEPFFTTKQRGSGTGLGLATVYGIAKQNGGWVCVRSAPGKGAAFSVFLPGSAAEPESPGGRLPRVEPVRGNETILIAEDNAEVREFACDVLRQRGYRILDAPDAAEAVELVLTHPGPVHLLLTDVVLPAASGKELATRIQELRKETRCVYMSGYAADAIGRRGVLDAGTNFLQKPFTPEALAAKVRAVLDAPPADPGK